MLGAAGRSLLRNRIELLSVTASPDQDAQDNDAEREKGKDLTHVHLSCRSSCGVLARRRRRNPEASTRGPGRLQGPAARHPTGRAQARRGEVKHTACQRPQSYTGEGACPQGHGHVVVFSCRRAAYAATARRGDR